MTGLGEYIRILGRGPGRSRGLTEAEAQAAMEIILRGEAAPEALGALLMLMRFRGESAEELAGFTRALRAALPMAKAPAPAVDWPSYAAGRTRGLPLFLLAARLVAQAGHPVLLHGWNSHQSPVADVRKALPFVGIAQAGTMAEAADLLARDGIAYLPLEVLSPPLRDLLRLRDILGLRSCMNTVARLLNPMGAPLSVQGVFHPPYRGLQRDAAQLLGQPASLTLKGGGGEFERHPGKAATLVGQRDGAGIDTAHPALLDQVSRLAEGPDVPPNPQSLADLWSGVRQDAFAEACVTGTAALVLGALRGMSEADALAEARALWQARQTQFSPA